MDLASSLQSASQLVVWSTAMQEERVDDEGGSEVSLQVPPVSENILNHGTSLFYHILDYHIDYSDWNDNEAIPKSFHARRL